MARGPRSRRQVAALAGISAAVLVSSIASCELIGGIDDRTLAAAGSTSGGGGSGAGAGSTATAASGGGGVSASSASSGSGTMSACGPSACDGGADLMSDAENCGRCGRSCMGGLCTAGACPIDLLTPNDDVGATVTQLAVDGTSLYWGSAGLSKTPSDAIEKVDKTGGSVAVVLAVATPRVALYEGVLYYTSASTGVVGSVGIDGSGAATLASGEPAPSTVVTDGTWVYYTSGQVAGVGVRRVPASGGAPEAFGVTASTSLGLCVDVDGVYWSALDTVYHEAKSGGTPTALALDQNVPGRPTTDADWVYFTNDYGGGVSRVAKGGGSVLPVATGQDKPGEALIAGGRLYWLQKPAGLVMSACPDGSDRQVIAAKQDLFVEGLTSDGTYLYWTQQDGAGAYRIYRTPR